MDHLAVEAVDDDAELRLSVGHAGTVEAGMVLVQDDGLGIVQQNFVELIAVTAHVGPHHEARIALEGSVAFELLQVHVGVEGGLALFKGSLHVHLGKDLAFALVEGELKGVAPHALMLGQEGAGLGVEGTERSGFLERSVVPADLHRGGAGGFVEGDEPERVVLAEGLFLAGSEQGAHGLVVGVFHALDGGSAEALHAHVVFAHEFRFDPGGAFGKAVVQMVTVALFAAESLSELKGRAEVVARVLHHVDLRHGSVVEQVLFGEAQHLVVHAEGLVLPVDGVQTGVGLHAPEVYVEVAAREGGGFEGGYVGAAAEHVEGLAVQGAHVAGVARGVEQAGGRNDDAVVLPVHVAAADDEDTSEEVSLSPLRLVTCSRPKPRMSAAEGRRGIGRMEGHVRHDAREGREMRALHLGAEGRRRRDG